MERLKYSIIMISYVLAGTIGFLFSFSHAFQITYDIENVCIATMLLCLPVTAVLCGRKKRDILIATGIAVAGNLISLWLYRKSLVESAAYISSKISVIWKDYINYGTHANASNLTGDGSAAMILPLGIIGCLLAFLCVLTKRAWASMILLTGGLALPFIVGEVPQNTDLFLLLYAMFGILSAKSGLRFLNDKKSKYKTGFTGVIAGLCILAVGTLFPGPQLKTLFQDQTHAKNTIQEFWDIELLGRIRSASGGVGNGAVGTAGEFGENDSPQLRITTDEKPTERLYLQGYIGTEYNSNKWHAADSNKFRKWSKEHNISAQELHNMSSLPLSGDNPDTDAYGQTLHIENIGANSKYRYVPYHSYYEASYKTEGDTYLHGGKRKYDVTFLPIQPAYSLPVDTYQTADYPDTSETDTEQAYLKYAAEEYCALPDEIRQIFNPVAEEITTSDVSTIAAQITAILDENAVYSLTPGVTPAGKDVAEYFYFENKKGYCEHFASVAVILLRIKGIPARYVSGYAAAPELFSINEDNLYEAVVTGDSAHAWAEIYVPGIGWTPVEATPAAQENALSTESTANTENTDETQPELPDTQDESDETQPELTETQDESETLLPNKSEQNTEKSTPISFLKNVLSVTMFILTAVVVTLILVFLIRRYQLLQTRKRIKNNGMNGTLNLLFYRINKLLVLSKCVDKNDELDDNYVKKVCEKHSDISTDDMKRMLDIVHQAAFGNQKTDRRDYQFCQDMYQKIKKKASSEMSYWKKFWWKYWYGI